ncbi:MAG TPA: hypothetical protein VFD72_01250 [Sphingobacteriaceae bacterium]|nr:hypothetical protein [Sphingobacteriaceae bacterium]
MKDYSSRRESTGLATAARAACQPTTLSILIKAMIPVRTNSCIGIPIRYAKFSSMDILDDSHGSEIDFGS